MRTSPIADALLGRVQDSERGIYVEQIQQLFSHVILLVMGATGAFLIDALALWQTGNPTFAWLGGAIVAITVLRYLMVGRFERAVAALPEDRDARFLAMRRWEMIYAIPTVAFAALIGLFSYEVMLEDSVELHVYIAFFISIFAGNLAIRHATRLRIVAAQVVCIMAPFTLGVVLSPAPNYWWMLAWIPMQAFSIRSTTALIHSMLAQALRSALESRVLSGQLEAALGNMSQGLCMADADGRALVTNAQFRGVLGMPASALAAGDSLPAFLAEAGLPELAAALDGPARTVMVRTRGARTVEARLRLMPGGGHLVVAEDVTEREEAARRIEHMAHYDHLTELPNRVLLRTFAEEAFAGSERAGVPFALLCLDLDNFKEVNDTLGHPVGDRLLKEVADRLRSLARPTDVVARFGGDEFVILHNPGDDDGATSCFAKRLVEEISRPYRVLGHDIANIGLSIGVAISGAHGGEIDALLKNADMALYRAKRDGRGKYCIFRPEMDMEAQDRRGLEADMRQAIAEEAFTVFYQPILDSQTGKVRCCEALIRWFHPSRGTVFPDKFIPLAEETGLIVGIGGVVLRKACREALNWPYDVNVAVNVSAVQFKQNCVVAQVSEALRLSGLPGHRLEIEITESSTMDDLDHTVQIVGELRKMGVKVSLDDFGKGQSSLAYLDRIPFNKVKIDKAFVDHIEDNQQHRSLMRLIAGYAAECSKTMVAEGVETEAQLDILRELGVPQVQGWLFSKARPADEIVEFLKAPPRPPGGLKAAA